jgi:hypothetical protein
MASAAGSRTAVLPSLAHLSPADFAHVYEPQEDTWLLCDALLRNEALLRASAPTLAVEIGCVRGCGGDWAAHGARARKPNCHTQRLPHCVSTRLPARAAAPAVAPCARTWRRCCAAP